MTTADPQASRQLGYVTALSAAHTAVMREVRSTAKRVPTDWRERAGYRKGLRQAAELIEALMEETK